MNMTMDPLLEKIFTLFLYEGITFCDALIIE